MEIFLKVVSSIRLCGETLIHRSNQEMHSKAVDPAYIQFRVRPGVIDIDHLELVALKRVAKASYMPHFRLIPPHPASTAPPVTAAPITPLL